MTTQQGSLFGGSDAYGGPLGATASAPTLAQARQARDEALAKADTKAPPGFKESAMRFITAYLDLHGPTPGEVLTDACVAAGIKPGDLKLFGVVYRALKHNGSVVVAGTCTRRRGNNTAGGSVYKLAGDERKYQEPAP